ncbi:intermediate conductance calcium-activated potassium channel protein 4 isoform X3 [Oncorhynchus masou masou]|uniref:intermediate conductance calcium-activated potassium channel protein 4 isoform X3 n=1 Tax=Oncorhynchus masou masou TaxID=90313 RepID=UPI003183BB55
MEMTTRNLHLDSKVDNCDGVINRNGGDMTEISVPLSHSGKRMPQIEEGNLYRLRDRKVLLENKKCLCAWALGTALLGTLLMILHAELCPFIYQPGSRYAFIINCSISISTGCLLILIVAFHYKDIRLFIIDHNQVDWRIAMTSRRVLGISLELLVCAIHPVGTYWEVGVPAPIAREGVEVNSSNSAPLCVSFRHGEVLLDTELLLSALMFLRLYLIHRTILLHSKVLLSASYRSIGSLNNINFTFRFVLKVLMNKYPARTLMVFIFLFWLIASWMLTLCERQTQEQTGRMDTALWLIAITFLTVGYGDVSPKTSCGKVVCLFTGVMVTIWSHGCGLYRHAGGRHDQEAGTEQRRETRALLHDGHPDLQTDPPCCCQRAEGVLAAAPQQPDQGQQWRAPQTPEVPTGGHQSIPAPAPQTKEAERLRQ